MGTLKNKLKKRVMEKPALTPAEAGAKVHKAINKKIKKIVRAKRIKKPAPVYDFTNIKGVKIEYFDSRFYKVEVPKQLDPIWLRNIPVNYIAELSHLAEKKESITYFRDIDIQVFEALQVKVLNIYFPSVTTIISGAQPHPQLERARGNLGNWEMDKRMEDGQKRGSSIHDACDKLAKGWAIVYLNPKRIEITERLKRLYRKKFKKGVIIITKEEEMIQVARYDRLVKLLKPQILKSEFEVYNFEECYAGTVDGEWLLQAGEYKLGRNTIIIPETGLYDIDIKSGAWYTKVDFAAQLISYIEANPKRAEIKGSLGIHLNAQIKTGIEGLKVHVSTREDLKPYNQHFLRLKDSYNFSNPAIPKLYEFPQIIVWEKGKK